MPSSCLNGLRWGSIAALSAVLLFATSTASAQGPCTSPGVCSTGSCASTLNYCYSNGTQQLTCCTSNCNNCDLATGQPPSPFQQLEVLSLRPQIPGPRHSAINLTDTNGGFSFSETLFTKLPADLNNPKDSESVGVFQGHCFVTATGSLPFNSSASLECVQSFYFLVDGLGTYYDSISYNAPFWYSGALTPGGISSGTGKYKLARGEVVYSRTVVSPDGSHSYDGVNIIYALT